MTISAPSFDELHNYIVSLKEKKHVTIQQISDATEIAKGTLDNFFSGAIKDSRFLNVAKVVKFLGGSLDEIAGIPRPAPEILRDPDSISREDLTKLLDEANAVHSRSLDEANKVIMYERRDKTILFIMCCVLVAALLYIIIDCLSPSWGMFNLR